MILFVTLLYYIMFRQTCIENVVRNMSIYNPLIPSPYNSSLSHVIINDGCVWESSVGSGWQNKYTSTID